MSDPLVLVESRPDGVTLVRLNRPPLNPLSAALLAELESVARELGADASVKAVVVTGSDKTGPLDELLKGDLSIPAGRVSQDRALILADRAAAGPLEIPAMRR